MIASCLTEADYSTALFTSPHLVDFRERMRIRGRMIPPLFVASWIRRHRKEILRRRITFFEATTAMAFDWFASRSVDIAIIETGLGGRLDATNVLDPLVTILTSISREHSHILGTSLTKIADEKAGIAKEGIPCILGDMPPRVTSHLRSRFSRNGIPCIPSSGVGVRAVHADGKQTSVRVGDPFRSVGEVQLSLPGSHQASNVRTSLAAIHVLRESYGLSVPDQNIRAGLRNTEENTGLRGRVCKVSGHRNVFIDVAHNPAAMRATASYFQAWGPRAFRIIFGISKDKDARSVLSQLRPIARELIVVEAMNHRRMSASPLMTLAKKLHIPVRAERSVREAVRSEIASKGRGPLLITGSHFVVGEALSFLEKKNYLTIDQ
jgi:dihydrofolate synthase/folylpolyglutamate synthase